MNYVLVGAFVLVLGAVLIAGALWLASGGAIREQYDMYLAIEEESVAGLNVNAPVKFNGVDVGKVREIHIDKKNPERVILLFAIERGTPVKEDTVAVLKTQGLTGIAYVELDGGTRDSPLLVARPPDHYPVIRTKPSLSARLENVLTSVLAKLDQTTSHIDAVFSAENQKAVANTLADIAKITNTFAARTSTLDAAITDIARTFEQGAQVAAQMGPVMERVGRSADALEKMGHDAALASTNAGKAVERVGSDVQRVTAETMPALQHLIGELDVMSASLRRLIDQTERHPSSLLFGRAPVPPGPGEHRRETQPQ